MAHPIPPYARPATRYLYRVYDSTNTSTRVFKGNWLDAGLPTWAESYASGVADMTAHLADRPYGAAGQPNESDSLYSPTLALSYGVDVYAIDPASLAAAGGNPATAGRLIYRGAIAEMKWRPAAATIDVVIVPIARLADDIQIAAGYSINTNVPGRGAGANKTVLEVAAELLAAKTSLLTWDSNNGTTATVVQTFVVNPAQSLRQALQGLAGRIGTDWIVYVTPIGTVRMFQQTRTATGSAGNGGSVRHIFQLGSDVIGPDAEFTQTAYQRIGYVTLVWGTRGDQTTQYPVSPDPLYPATVTISRPDITNSTDASTAAQAYFNEYNVDKIAARVTIRSDYPRFWEIRIGDPVRLTVPRVAPGTGTGWLGYVDPNGRDLIVLGMQFNFDTVTLELDEEQATSPQQVAEVKQQADKIEKALFDGTKLAKDGSALSAETADLQARGLKATGDPGAGVAGRFTITNAITTAGGGIGLKVYDGTTTRYIVLSNTPP